MKKIIAVVVTLALLVGLSACGGKESGAKKSELKVGLIQLVEHTSLDEIRESFTTELEKLSSEKGLTVKIDYQNAQNDMSFINSICRNFVEDKVDVIVAIATPTAQGALSVAKDIPIVFSAVTDPVAAGLLTNLEAPEGNVTGVSDAIDVESIFNLAGELTPDVNSYGLIYNKGEVNSVSVIEQVKKYLDGAGKSYTEKIVANSGEVQQATRALLEDNDALFVPIDNTVASAMAVVSSEAKAAKKPVYVAADSMVIDGGLATVGVNYTTLGQQTAAMTIKVLTGSKISDIPVEIMAEGDVVVNEETATAIGVDVSSYVK